MATTLKAIAAGNTTTATKWQEIATTAIVSCSNTNTLITLSGDVTATYGAGVKFTLVGTVSALNDGAYVVSSSTLNGGNTDITPTVAPAADEASETGTSSINRVPVSTDGINLNGKSMVQAGGDFTIASIEDVATGGLFEITDTFTVTGYVTDALLYCNSTVDTISIGTGISTSYWTYTGAGAALDVGASGNITTISSTSGLDMTSSTGSALTNAGTIGTYSVNISGGSSSAYMIENTGTITTFSGYIDYTCNYGIHNNGGTIGDITDTSGNLSCSNIVVYNESGTISDISGYIQGNDKTVWNKGTITTITGKLETTSGTYALYNEGGTIGDVTGTYANSKGIYVGSGYGIYNTSSGSIGDVENVYMSGSATYGVYADGGSIGDVTIHNNNTTAYSTSYGFYNSGCTDFGYLTIDGNTGDGYSTAIGNESNNVTYTGAVSVSGYYSKGFENFGSPTDVIVDVDFSGTLGAYAYVYWDNGSGEFTGTVTDNGGSYGCVYVSDGTFTYSGDITTSGSYGLYLGYGASGTFNGTVTNNGSGAGVYNNAGAITINTAITNTSDGIGYQHQTQGGTYAGTLINTGSGDGIRITGYDPYMDDISGIVISTNGYPYRNTSSYGIGVKKISGTVSYTPGVTNLSAGNIATGKTILGVEGSIPTATTIQAKQRAIDLVDVTAHTSDIKQGTEKRLVMVGQRGSDYPDNASIHYSKDGITSWVSVTPFDTENPTYAVVGVLWNGTKFVAGSSAANTIYTSPDGANWTIVSTTGLTSNVLQIAWDGTNYIAGAGNGGIFKSSNLTSWTNPVTSGSYYGICWNGTTWVAGGANALKYSSDGTTWSNATGLSGIGYIREIAYGAGKFVAVARTGTDRIAYSSDGQSWTGLGSSIIGSGDHIAWSGTRFVITYENSTTIAYSTDGINWTTKDIGGGNAPGPIVWDGDNFVTQMRGGTYLTKYSADGINWSNGALRNNDESTSQLAVKSMCSAPSYLIPAVTAKPAIGILGEEGTLASGGGETSSTFS